MHFSQMVPVYMARKWCANGAGVQFLKLFATRMPELNPQTLESIIHSHLQRSGLTEAMLTGPGRARHVTKVRTDIAVEALE